MSDCCEPGENEKQTFDLVIIGGGSAGFAAAIRANELSKSVLMVNEGLIGGTCVNVGCVPSKTLIRAAEQLHRTQSGPFDGIEQSGRLSDYSLVNKQKDELVEQMRSTKYIDVLKQLDRVTLVNGRAEFEDANTIRVGSRRFHGDRFLIATGTSAWLPPIPGLRESKPLTSTTAFEMKVLPRSMIVMGGRYIGLELAQMFSRLGVAVTLLQRSDRILPSEDSDVTDELTRLLKREGVNVVTGVSISNVQRSEDMVLVTAVVDSVETDFTADRILCATGRTGITEQLNLEAAQVEIDERGFIVVDENLESSSRGIFAAGDVIGEPSYVYTAAYEGKLAVSNAFNEDVGTRDYRALPWVIFTDPQVTGVGLNELEARELGIEVDVATMDLANVPRALAARDTRGFVKLIRRRGSDELIGARIIGPESGDMIMEPVLAIKHGISVTEISNTFHPYLTMSEGVKLCALSFDKDVAMMSCCAS